MKLPDSSAPGAPAPGRAADGRAEIGAWLSERIQKNKADFQRGLLTEKDLRSCNLSCYEEARKRLGGLDVPAEERASAERALRCVCGLPPVRVVPAGMDVPQPGGLFYVRFSLWPEFPPEEERLNRDFELPVMEGQRAEKLCFRLNDRTDAQTADGVPCTEYRGYGRLPGYTSAEMSLLVAKTDHVSAAVILKLYPDLADSRWDAYFKWSAETPT